MSDYRMEQRAKHRRIRARKRKKRRQMISLLLFFFLLLFIASKLVQFIFSSNTKEEKILLGPAIVWHFNKIQQEAQGNYQSNLSKEYSWTEMSTIALDRASTFDFRIMPGSNHLLRAEAYAYDTGEIRSVIRGEKEYIGNQKIVFLTFDDGPNTTITPQILDILQREKVPATFFIVGKFLQEKNIPMLRRALNEGHGIALHSDTHDYKHLYPGRSADVAALIEEAEKIQNKLQSIFGSDFKSQVWRYPGGHMSWNNMASADKALSNLGIEWIDWNCLTGDAEVKSHRPTTIQGQVQYLDQSLHKNEETKIAVVLSHDGKNKQLTADSLPSVIAYFKDQGYEFGILK